MVAEAHDLMPPRTAEAVENLVDGVVCNPHQDDHRSAPRHSASIAYDSKSDNETPPAGIVVDPSHPVCDEKHRRPSLPGRKHNPGNPRVGIEAQEEETKCEDIM